MDRMFLADEESSSYKTRTKVKLWRAFTTASLPKACPCSSLQPHCAFAMPKCAAPNHPPPARLRLSPDGACAGRASHGLYSLLDGPAWKRSVTS
eukprot:1874900-Rhodomonas_salina.2